MTGMWKNQEIVTVITNAGSDSTVDIQRQNGAFLTVRTNTLCALRPGNLSDRLDMGMTT